MKPSRLRALALGATSGILLVLAFPEFDLAPVGWIALVPLIVHLRGGDVRAGVIAGWSCGVAFFGLLLHWILGTILRESGMPLLLCPMPWMLLVAYLAAHVALFSWLLVRAQGRYGTRALWLAPFLWTGLEWGRGTWITGFPWGVLGASQQALLTVAQVASIGGVYGLSFVLAGFSAGCAVLLEPGLRRRSRVLLTVTLVAVPGACWGWGAWRLRERPDDPASGTPPLRVACVQGSFGSEPDPARGPEILGTYETLTRDAAAAGARLIVWPESGTPWGIEMNEGYRAALEKLARETGAGLVVGSIGGPVEGPWANSAFLVRPEGLDPVRYDKIHLVPYGEYVPRLTGFVHRFVSAIGEFETGAGPVVWDCAGAKVSPLICYEAIFPDLAGGAAASGATVLVNLTNDGWFETSAGPWQHLALARMRAIETGRPLVRAANTGVSAIFDARGRLLASAPPGARASIDAVIHPSGERTPFAAIGPAVPLACAILTALLAARELAALSSRDPFHDRP